MGLTIDDVKRVKKEFQKEYWGNPTTAVYINSVGISSVSLMSGRQKEPVDLSEGESVDDLCLCVGFERDPPAEMKFPDMYKGVRVFYETIGEIRAL